MNRREFILASAAATGLAGCASLSAKSTDKGGILFGAIFAFAYDRFRGRFGNVRYFHR